MNSETCERLYNAYYMRVFSYVMTLSGDRHTSEEITQEAFFRAFSKSASFRIHTVLHNMDEPYREVFELRVFGELSFSQIGTIFGKTENWARVTYHRARIKLQEKMSGSE